MKFLEDRIWIGIGIGLFFGVILLTFFISNNYEVSTQYSTVYRKHDALKGNISWIHCDAEIDDPYFTLCDDGQVLNHYRSRPSYQEGDQDFEELIIAEFADCPKDNQLDGFITIRFMVNCEGQAGRFRVYEFDSQYRDFSFSYLTPQLIRFIKGKKNWTPGKIKGHSFDSFYHFTCRVEDGIITGVKL